MPLLLYQKHQRAALVPIDNQNSSGVSGDYLATDVEDALYEIDFRSETKEPTGFLNTFYDSTISFNESTLEFSIAPKVTSFKYFIRGREYTKTTTESVYITDTDGFWLIYYDGSTLTAKLSTDPTSKWGFDQPIAFVATIYWNATSNKAVIFNEERHGLVEDWATHRYSHYTAGMIHELYKFTPTNYILRGDGSLDTHAQIGWTDLGRVFDEDLDFLPINSASPTNPYEQIINPYLYVPMLYRSGASGIWDKITATQFPLAWTAGQRISYNQWTGATWQLTQASEGYFVNSWVALTNDPRNPFIAFVGQNQYTTVVDAANSLWKDVFGNTSLPSFEILPLVKLIFKTSSSYTNQPKAILYAVLPIGEVAIDNDRYTVEMGSNGNVGVGKYLERSTGAGSNDNPFIFPEASFIRYVLVQAQAGTLNTVTIGVFRITDLVNPVISMSLNNQNYAIFPFSQYFSSGEQIAYRITAGSINKPLVTTWIQTQLG